MPKVVAELNGQLVKVVKFEGAYVWQSLWQSGAVVTNGTDAPVEDIDPIPSLFAIDEHSIESRFWNASVFVSMTSSRTSLGSRTSRNFV